MNSYIQIGSKSELVNRIFMNGTTIINIYLSCLS